MRPNLIVASAACLVLVACGGNDLESLGPPPEASPTGNVSPPSSPSPAVTGATGATGVTGGTGSPLSTTSPGITGSVDAGNASIAVSGAMHVSETALLLSNPAIYSPPPGAFALGWETDDAEFALGGTSFVGNHPTSATLRLTFSIGSGSDSTSFASDDGGCDVIVTTAEVTAFEGTFSCAGITDEDGSIVVNAQGTFSATG